MKWYKAGEMQRFHQPVGRQYTYDKEPEYDSEEARLQTDIRYLKQHIEVLKKYKELKRFKNGYKI